MLNPLKCLLGMIALPIFANTALAESELDLTDLPKSGVIIERDFSGLPYWDGTLETYVMRLPDFEQGLVFMQSKVPHIRGTKNQGLGHRAGNRVTGKVFHPGEVIERATDGLGQLMILKMRNGRYRAILPLAQPESMSWFHPDESDQWRLDHGTLGVERVSGDLPLVAYVEDANPYVAVAKAYSLGLEQIPEGLRGRLREEKDYPEPFRYLGWCTWEAYSRSVSEKLILETMADYKQSGLPVKYILIDGGHWSFDKGVGPLEKSFPNGYGQIKANMDGQPFQWLGLHYQTLGWNAGILPGEQNDLGQYNKHMRIVTRASGDRIMPKDTYEDCAAWWEYLSNFGADDGASFFKIDFLKDPLIVSGGFYGRVDRQANSVRFATHMVTSMEDVMHQRGFGLINCNGNTQPLPFYRKYSVITRCSEDYRKHHFELGRTHTYNSYANMILLGHSEWGDHDMFHSSDEFAGELMAVSKALSGGPIYFSDKPDEAVSENIYPLCYQDGKLLRPLAPALISESSLFYDVFNDSDRLFKAFAPVVEGTVSIHLINLNKEAVAASETITIDDYRNASSMMQPYQGPWEVPAEGIALYDILDKRGEVFDSSKEVTVENPLGHKLYQLSAIENGWSFIGCDAKYLAAATGEVVSSTAKKLVLKLVEPGSFVIYSASGKPKSKGIQFEDMGNGFYRGETQFNKIVIQSAKG